MTKQWTCKTYTVDWSQCSQWPASKCIRECASCYSPFDRRRIKSPDATHDATTLDRCWTADSKQWTLTLGPAATGQWSTTWPLSTTDPSLILAALQFVMRPFPIILFVDIMDAATTTTTAAAAAAVTPAAQCHDFSATFSARSPRLLRYSGARFT